MESVISGYKLKEPVAAHFTVLLYLNDIDGEDSVRTGFVLVEDAAF